VWKQTALQNFIDSLFSEKQFIIIDKLTGDLIGSSHCFSRINYCNSYKLNYLKKKNREGQNSDINIIYKCFLKRIRRECDRKCQKYYRRGILTNLCTHCKAYIKIRYQFENIKNDWDLYSRVGKINLNSHSYITFNTASLNRMAAHLGLENLSELTLFNIQSYMLFHSLKVSFDNWIIYITNRKYANQSVSRFSVVSSDKKAMKLVIYY